MLAGTPLNYHFQKHHTPSHPPNPPPQIPKHPPLLVWECVGVFLSCRDICRGKFWFRDGAGFWGRVRVAIYENPGFLTRISQSLNLGDYSYSSQGISSLFALQLQFPCSSNKLQYKNWDSPDFRQGPESPFPGKEGFGVLKPPSPVALTQAG